MRIYSNKFENSILWDDDLPAGQLCLNIDATDSNVDKLYNSIFTELAGYNEDEGFLSSCKDRAWSKLWEHEDLDECYVWIPETDPQSVIDLDLGEIEWDDESGFEFPDFFTDIARSQYVMLAQYNIAYGYKLTGLDDPRYLLYAEFCKKIESGSTVIRFKNQSPYNSENKKIVLVKTGITEKNLTGAWNQIDFVESEKMFDLCKSLDIKYPVRWVFDREHRIDKEIRGMLKNNGMELNAMFEAKKTVQTKREELEKQLTELDKQLIDIHRKLPALQQATELTKIDIENYRKELLSK